MDEGFFARIRDELTDIDRQGLTKPERVIATPQGAEIRVLAADGALKPALNFCANNYLGLAGDPRVADAAAKSAREWGGGLSSVRFICGTQVIHKDLERAVAEYLKYDDCILFAACFDANGGVFEPLFGENDAIVSDALNHASIIDGIRLTKAKRYRFNAGNMDDLEEKIRTARNEGARTVVIATDGAFSMDGLIANLPAITTIAARYGALTMVDDCHATGFLGPEGRGSAAFHNVEGKVDILTGTFGKALGGAMGGFICARKEVVALLRQRARPYLFSNALAPAVCGASMEAIRIARSDEGNKLREQLKKNAARFRAGMEAADFELKPGEHPIVPVMLGDAALAQKMAARLLDDGIYVIGFSFPVVPRGQARIRVQLSAAHNFEHIDRAIAAFTRVRDEIGKHS